VADDGSVKYVRAPDGVHLAYRVVGSGPVDLLDVNNLGAFFSLDTAFDQPMIRRFEEDLGRFCRLIRFDPQGIGSSDPLTEPPTPERWAAHALAVLDAVGSKKAFLMGTGLGTPVAVTAAVEHPERVCGLVLVNGFAKVTAAPGYELGIELELFDKLAAATNPDQSTGSDIDAMAPSIAEDAELRRWWTRESRRGATVANALKMWRYSGTVDVREALPDVCVPTLVVYSSRCLFIPPRFSRWLAQRIPDARLVEIASSDYVLWAIRGDALVGEIEEFITGRRTSGRHILAAILFTDIVDSTARNASEGDRVWLERLAQHDAIVRQHVRRFGGMGVKSTGDGVLATFPTPSLAIRCATSIAADTESIGLPIRAAVHAAEIEHRDDDVFGLGVTIASRVLGHAAPGQVLATVTVAGLLAGSEVRFEPLGGRDLKGVPGTWDLFAVRMD